MKLLNLLSNIAIIALVFWLAVVAGGKLMEKAEESPRQEGDTKWVR